MRRPDHNQRRFELSALHLPTVSAFSAILSSFLGLATLWLWTRDRGEPALGSWALTRLISSVGTVMLGLRGVAPDWMSIDLANALVCISFGLNWTGARQFEGRRPIPWALLAGTVIWLAACRIPAFQADADARVALMALVLLVYNSLTLAEFIRGQRALPLPSRPVFIALLGGVTVIYLVMTFVTLAFSPRAAGPLPQAYWLGALLLLNVVLLGGGTLLLVALVKEKAEARSTAALAAARDAADRASLNKTQFLSRMSHELRTPLNAVLGLAQVLAADSSLAPEQRRKAETLEQAGRHLLAILNDVLDISRIEAGRFIPEPGPLRLEEFLRRHAALWCGRRPPREQVELSLQLDPALPPAIAADALRVRQVLMNLLANAIRFTPPGGTVALEVAPRDGMVGFAVTDTGSGVPAALRPHLFEEFAQASGDEARSGSGLGLAISAALAEAMGGRLTHEDGPQGRGSRFTLSLPLVAAEIGEAEGAPTLPAGPPAKELNILVVDDIATNRLVAAELLKAAGHRVIQAPSGLSALALLEREPLPDLILMDERMPGLDGSATVRRIRAMPGPVAQLPIVALTADVLPGQVQAMMAAGFDDHLAKPVQRGELLAAVARWGGGHGATGNCMNT
jgi:signal transduction histidine kinase/ActR/RegA family two-component response regulator